MFQEQTDHIRETFGVSRSILAVRFGIQFGSFKKLLRMFKLIFINFPNVASMYILEYSGIIIGAYYSMYGKRSGSMHLVLGAFGTLWMDMTNPF